MEYLSSTLKIFLYNRIMPQPLKKKLPPAISTSESIGKRLTRLRKQQGFTQEQLAAKIGIQQALVSKYEKDNLKLSADMLLRFAKVLHTSADEILGLKESKNKELQPTLRIIRRLNSINSLSANEQKALLHIIDGYLKGVVNK